MNKLLILSLFIFSIALSAIEENLYEVEYKKDEVDHLEVFNYFSDKYKSILKQKLFLNDGRYGRFVIRPSFDPESCLSVTKNSQGLYIADLAEATENLYYALHKKNVSKIRKFRRKMNAETAVLIQWILGYMIHRASYPEHSTTGTLDATIFTFSVHVKGLGTIQGRTSNFGDNTPAKLASLSEELAAFVKDENIEETKLIKKLKMFKKVLLTKK